MTAAPHRRRPLAAALEGRGTRAPAALGALALALGVLAGRSPQLAVGLALAFAFLAVVLADLTWGLCLFVLVAFLEVVPALGPGLSTAKVAGLVLALAWLARMVGTPRDRESFFGAHPAVSWLAAGFLAWAAASVLWASDEGASLSALLRYALDLSLLPIVFAAITRRRHVVWFSVAFLAGATLSAVYGILVPHGQDQSRLYGAGLDPNELGLTLVAAVALGVGLAAGGLRSGLARLASAGAALVCLLGLLATASRGGLVSLAAAGLAGIALAGRGRRAPLAVLGVLIACCGLFWYSSLASPVARARITASNRGSGRVDIWTVGWRMVERHPLQGVGVGNFAPSAVDYLLVPGAIERADLIVDTPKVAHNVYLQVLAELGVVGLAAFLPVFLFSVRCSLRAARAFARAGDVAMDVMARALAVACLAMFTAGIFLSAQFDKPMWLALAVGPCLLALSARPGAAGAREP